MKKIVVVGAGSIGNRHLLNLQSLGYANLFICEPDIQKRKVISAGLKMSRTFEHLEDVPLQSGDIVFICTPPHLHIKLASFAAKAGCHLFIEKPLSNDLEGIQGLVQQIQQSRLITLVGCNMRFHPGVQKIRALLKEEAIGKIYSFHVEAGSYLPSWRPQTDYRLNYSAKRVQGGGVLFDMIHELDYIRWFFGDPSEILGYSRKISVLDIDSDDVAEIILVYDFGVGSAHFDYFSRSYTRRIHIIGENGNLTWDWNQKQGVEHFNGKTEKTIFYPVHEHFELNDMYLNELRYFLDCVESGQETFSPVSEARYVLEMALAAKRSSEEHKSVLFQRSMIA